MKSSLKAEDGILYPLDTCKSHFHNETTVVVCRFVCESQFDVFLAFIPMFHIYGLLFFGLGLLCVCVTTISMQKYDLPAVPPMILALVKHARKARCDLSSLRRVGLGAAPLSKEVAQEFRRMFPWIELRQGYGLTESSGGATFFASDKDTNAHTDSCGKLIPTICAKVVDIETGKPLPPQKEGELWFKSPTIMKGYLGNLEATSATIDSEGWLRTGDLGYIDENGFVYIVERIKELIKYNGYQVLKVIAVQFSIGISVNCSSYIYQGIKLLVSGDCCRTGICGAKSPPYS